MAYVLILGLLSPKKKPRQREKDLAHGFTASNWLDKSWNSNCVVPETLDPLYCGVSLFSLTCNCNFPNSVVTQSIPQLRSLLGCDVTERNAFICPIPHSFGTDFLKPTLKISWSPSHTDPALFFLCSSAPLHPSLGERTFHPAVLQ